MDAEPLRAKMNADGTRMVAAIRFTQTNPHKIFLIKDDGSFTALTSGPSSEGFPDASRGFERISFVSDGDWAGANPDGWRQVFVYEVAGGVYHQLTSHTGSFGHVEAEITDDGSAVFYWLLTQDTAQLRRVDVATRLDEELVTLDGNLFGSSETDETGTKIVFSSDADPLGENPDEGYELFIYDALAGELAQLTASSSPNNESLVPSIDASLSKVAFITDTDYALDSETSSLSNYAVVLDVATGQGQVLSNAARQVWISRDGTAAVVDRVGVISRYDLRTGEGVLVPETSDPISFGVFSPDDDASRVPFSWVVNGQNQLWLARCAAAVFADGFESGDTSAWATTVP